MANPYYENFSDALHLLDVRSEVHDEALPIVALGDSFALADVFSFYHKEMPTVDFGDDLALSDVIVPRPNQRYVADFSDAIGLLDVIDSWRGEHYYRTFRERLSLSSLPSQYATQRHYIARNDRLIIEDILGTWKGDRFSESPDDVLGLSDEMWIRKGHHNHLSFEDEFLLVDDVVLKFPLFVVGGEGSGYYQHGERVPISVTLTGDEKFLVWSGEEHFIEEPHAKSTFIHMPSGTVRVRAIKGDVSLKDIQALGGKVSAAKLDIIMEQGSSFERNLYYRDSDGNPIVMTGWTAAMHVRKQKEALAALLTLTSSAGYITIEGASGHLEVHIPANEMDDLNFIWGFYDLELYPEGDTTQAFRLLEGRIRLTKEVTV